MLAARRSHAQSPGPFDGEIGDVERIDGAAGGSQEDQGIASKIRQPDPGAARDHLSGRDGAVE